MMDLDQLQSVRDRERQTDKLQQLRESFYADAADLVAELREERDRAAAAAEDPFDDPRVSRLTDQINTAEQTVEAIYEKRVGKLVKAASFAAADLPAETEGMTAEEQDLFDALVDDIRANRQRVLDVLAGEGQPADGPAPTGDAGEGSDEVDEVDAVDGVDGVDAASVMGGSDEVDPPAPPAPEEDIFPDADVEADPEAVDASRPAPPSSGEDESVDERGGATQGAPDDGGDSPASDAGDDSEEAEEPPGSEPAPGGDSSADEEPGAPDAEEEEAAPDVERTTVRITADVGEIFGVDEREYHLEADQIVTLPSANAEPLLEQDAAERVER